MMLMSTFEGESLGFRSNPNLSVRGLIPNEIRTVQ
jgi:hypothetical protein